MTSTSQHTFLTSRTSKQIVLAIHTPTLGNLCLCHSSRNHAFSTSLLMQPPSKSRSFQPSTVLTNTPTLERKGTSNHIKLIMACSPATNLKGLSFLTTIRSSIKDSDSPISMKITNPTLHVGLELLKSACPSIRSRLPFSKSMTTSNESKMSRNTVKGRFHAFSKDRSRRGRQHLRLNHASTMSRARRDQCQDDIRARTRKG